jgi:hypothetical protein
MTKAWLALALLLAGCSSPTTSVGIVPYIEPRPDSIRYESSNGNWCLVWGHGPVNVACNLRAYSATHPVGQLGQPTEAGAGYVGTFDHTPVPGDTLRGALIMAFPAVDSLGALRGGFLLECVTADSLAGYGWAILPSGKYDRDSVWSYLALTKTP